MASPLEGKRLLLVAEDVDLARLVAQALARLGAQVETVPSGRAALDALARRAPNVAVLDLPLADVRGSDVLAALGRSGIPAVALSGVYRGPRAADEVRRLGACDFFEKPFRVDALAVSVARALGVSAPGLSEEARDEVTGSRTLVPDEVTAPIAAAAPLPALDDRPVFGGRAGGPGLESPLPDAPPARAPAVPDGAPPPARGNLAHTSLPRLLVAIHRGQATGALTLARGAIRRILVFEAGAPVYAASNVAAERFGPICVRRGIVSQERLDELRCEAPANVRTAYLLTNAGLLSPARRVELLVGQIRAIAWSTFDWRDGTYEFQLGRPPSARVPVRVPMGDLILEGILRTSTLARLREELPPDAHLAPSPDPAFELYALGLRPKEAHLLSAADGTKSVADLVRLSDLPERDALAFLEACRIMGVLDEVNRVLASTRRIGFM